MLVLLVLLWIVLYAATLLVAVHWHSWWLLLIAAVLTFILARAKHYRLMCLPAMLLAAMICAIALPLLSDASPIESWRLWSMLEASGWGWLTEVLGTVVMGTICVVGSFAFIGTMVLTATLLIPNDYYR